MLLLPQLLLLTVAKTQAHHICLVLFHLYLQLPYMVNSVITPNL